MKSLINKMQFLSMKYRSMFLYNKKRIQRYLDRERQLRGGESVDVDISLVDKKIKQLVLEAKKHDGMVDYPTTRPHLAFDYLAGLVGWLANSDYSVLSYNDTFCRNGEEQNEFHNWIAQATLKKEKGVLLQYDVDARCDVSMALLKEHIKYNVPANLMVFRKKIFDWKLKQQGKVCFDDSYELDFKLMNQFEKMGGVIGYHCNAFDQAAGDLDRAIEILYEDVIFLRKNFDLKYISMHGGHISASGGCNANMPVMDILNELGLTWVHNGHSVYFNNTWSDGSASNPKYKCECSDPLDFILSTKVGQRSRLLFHPQYYNDMTNSCFDFPIAQDQAWVQETKKVVMRGSFQGEKYWQNRFENAQHSIDKYRRLFKMKNDSFPVFINGMSRSGTTLMCSLFDAHPDGAMGYESYPRYLHVPADDGVLTPERYIFAYQALINVDEHDVFQRLNMSPLKNLMRFSAVTSWTGMNTVETGELLRAYLTNHDVVADSVEALKVVTATINYKVKKENAKFWGTKCQGNFKDYLTLHPASRFVYILRDGLDVFASQKKNGSFNPDPKKLGKQWRDHYNQFLRFKERNPKVTMEIVTYEDLVKNPEHVMKELCTKLGVTYHPQMTRQHEIETTLTKQPRGQLSAERVQQPIDDRSVKKWVGILSENEVALFLDGCGGRRFYNEMGYGLGEL